MSAPELIVRELTDKLLAPMLRVPPEIVTAPLSGNLPLPLNCTRPELTVVPPVYTLLPERVKVPEPALVTLPVPEITPAIVLDGLVVVTDSAATFETEPAIFNDALVTDRFAVTVTPLVAALY